MIGRSMFLELEADGFAPFVAVPVEIEHYPVAYFDRVTVFKAL